MSAIGTILGYLFLAFMVGGMFGCSVFALAWMASGNTAPAPAPDADSGAVEGMTNPYIRNKGEVA